MEIGRPVKDIGRALERVWVVFVRQEPFGKGRADHACFHDRAVEQVAAEIDEAGLGLHRRVDAENHIRIGDGAVPAVGADRLPVRRHRIRVRQQLVAHQFADHRRHAAGAVIVLAQIFPGRLQVHQKRHLVAMRLPVVIGQIDAEMPCHRIQMNRRVRRPADGRVQDDGVLEGGTGHDVGGFQIIPDHVDDPVAGVIGHLSALAVGCRNGGRARKLHAQPLGKRIHRRRRSHGIAIAGRGRRRGDEVEEAVIIDLAGGDHLPGLPDDGAGPGALALVPAIQHRTDRQGDGRNIDRCGRHQQCRGCLVAADHQHDAVDRVAVQGLDKAEIGKVAVQHGGRPLAGFLNGMNRNFDGKAAGGDDAVSYALRQFKMMPVAGGQVRSGLRQRDDRAPVAQFLAGQAVIEVTLGIERRHLRIVGIVEPLPRAQLFRFYFSATHSR